jgi:hypothetical protein
LFIRRDVLDLAPQKVNGIVARFGAGMTISAILSAIQNFPAACSSPLRAQKWLLAVIAQLGMEWAILH